MNIYIIWKYDILELAGCIQWFVVAYRAILHTLFFQQYDVATIAHWNRETAAAYPDTCLKASPALDSLMPRQGTTCGFIGGIGNRITIGAGTWAMLDEDNSEIISPHDTTS